MKLVVPTNWDDALIDKLKGLPVDLLYAKLKRDALGGGRSAESLPDVSKESAQQHIKKAHDNGIKFNYVLNTTCIGNKEFVKSYRDSILKEIEWIAKQKVEYVTISIPYIMELVKKNFPQIKIVASVFLNIDSIQKALFYQNFGVSEIVLDQSQGRNFVFLKNLKKNIKVDLQLVANNICLIYCPFRLYHQNINSHASQYDNEPTCNVSDFYVTLSCEKIRINNPEEIIKSPWIRPEDLNYYEEIGIERFKISGRTKSTDWISKIAHAYADRKSPDNFAELLSFPISPKIPQAKIQINNKLLGNLLDGFKNRDCKLLNCKTCGYCLSIAQKTVEIDSNEVGKVTAEYDKLLTNLSAI